MYQISPKRTKWAYNFPNVRKIFRMSVKISTFFNLRRTKIYPNWDFLIENKPSGNPDDNPCVRLQSLQNQSSAVAQRVAQRKSDGK
jgi:hypothetical protein